jgi:hypothetical protein
MAINLEDNLPRWYQDLAKETLKKRSSIVAKWDEFLLIFKLGTFKDLLKNEDLAVIDNNVAKFFQNVHVGKEDHYRQK